MATHRATHIPLEPGVNAVPMKSVITCIDSAHFLSSMHQILANGARFFFRI
jgi:hypothetical protein